MIKKICTALLAVLTTLTAGTFLVVAATGAQAKGGPGPGPYGSACPQLRFFGIRGSGEKPSDNSGYGPTIWQMRFMLLQLFPGTATSAVDYPAIDVQWWNPNYAIAYEKSVEVGVQSLTNQYDLFRANCATTPVVFAGYSQGVDVAYRVYKSLPPSEQSRIILTGLGDPHFNPAQRWVDEGSFNPKLQSILVHFWGDTPHSFPRGDANHVRSWCSEGDPVCNYSAGWLTACALMLPMHQCLHQIVYIEGDYTLEAAYWVYNAWTKIT